MPNSKFEEIEEYLVDNYKKFFWIGVLQSFTTLDLTGFKEHTDDNNFCNTILKIDEMHNNEVSLIETHDYHSKTHEDVMRDMSYCGRIHDLQFDSLENMVKGSTYGVIFQILCIIFYLIFISVGIYKGFNSPMYAMFVTFYPAIYFIIIMILTTNRTEISNKILENNNG